MKKPRRLGLMVTLALLLSVYQNCAPIDTGQNGPSENSSGIDKVIGSTADVSRVEFGPQVENFQYSEGVSRGVDIDLVSGKMIHQSGQNVNECDVPQDDLAVLRDLLAQAEVCELVPMEGVAYCMMYVPADIRLSGGQDTFLLRRGVCGNGPYLCGDFDRQLRSRLQELTSSGCR